MLTDAWVDNIYAVFYTIHTSSSILKPLPKENESKGDELDLDLALEVINPILIAWEDLINHPFQSR